MSANILNFEIFTSDYQQVFKLTEWTVFHRKRLQTLFAFQRAVSNHLCTCPDARRAPVVVHVRLTYVRQK